MRMMTGAILLLAGSFLMGLYQIDSAKMQSWIEWYSFILTVFGWGFIGWGLYRDILATRYRKHHRFKGDS